MECEPRTSPRFWVDGIEVGGSLDSQGRVTLSPEASNLFARARAENRKGVVLVEYEPCMHIWTPHTGSGQYACQKCGTPYSAEVAAAQPSLGEMETKRWLAEWDPIEEYIRALPWAADAPDIHKTLVGGNIRAFYGWLLRRESDRIAKGEM